MKMTINKQQLLVEFISVVFAVLLALFLNAWRESAAEEARLERVKDAIRVETIRNDSLVRKSFTYRKELIRSFYNNNHLIFKAHLNQIPVDVYDEEELANFFKQILVFGQRNYYNRVSVESNEDQRVLILDKQIFDIETKKDSLSLYGIGNIELKVPYLNNQSWEIAQGTGTISDMGIDLVRQLSIINTLLENYAVTGQKAMDFIYDANQMGILSIMEDLNYMESQIIKADSVLLELL